MERDFRAARRIPEYEQLVVPCEPDRGPLRNVGSVLLRRSFVFIENRLRASSRTILGLVYHQLLPLSLPVSSERVVSETSAFFVLHVY